MKSEYRRFFKNLRREMTDTYIGEKSDKIYENLIASDLYKNAKSIFIYYSVGKEVKTKEIIKKALADKKKVYIPKIKGKEMIDARLESLDDLVAGDFSIPTTKSNDLIENPDLTIVPGLSFDKNKNRLGYGGGYYDRFLAKNKTIKVGLIIEDFKSLDLETDEYDIKMDYIISDKKIY